jgi:hypothetical protein
MREETTAKLNDRTCLRTKAHKKIPAHQELGASSARCIKHSAHQAPGALRTRRIKRPVHPAHSAHGALSIRRIKRPVRKPSRKILVHQALGIPTIPQKKPTKSP